MHKELLCELEKAMTSNPDLSALEVIEYVLDCYDPYRTKYYPEDLPYVSQDKEVYSVENRRTNSDIVKCLKRFNNRK